uniref:Uncharacterized protein n=1 Tax=Vespula pensylvanica TaxID=30213 RepID=A0A834U9I2_VESPE|nr:hypothetical protein H0235_009070 [Vespula pensylvanica]
MYSFDEYGWPHSDAPKHVIEFSNFHLQCTDALVRIPFHASYPADIKSLKSATANISKGREGHRVGATKAGATAAAATAPAEPVEALAAPVAALAAPATFTDQYLHSDEVNDDKWKINYNRSLTLFKKVSLIAKCERNEVVATITLERNLIQVVTFTTSPNVRVIAVTRVDIRESRCPSSPVERRWRDRGSRKGRYCFLASDLNGP